VGQPAASRPCEVTKAGSLVTILLQLWQLGQEVCSFFDVNVTMECVNWNVNGSGIRILNGI
jgi:hypothetical protein